MFIDAGWPNRAGFATDANNVFFCYFIIFFKFSSQLNGSGGAMVLRTYRLERQSVYMRDCYCFRCSIS